MKTYKGFNKDMICRGYQYEEGKEYETNGASVCNYGFHACEYPLDCFSYYAPNDSVFHEVEQSGEISKHNKDTKIASSKIKIGAKISIAGLVNAAIEYTKERVNPDAKSNERHGASSVEGNCGASSATGDYGASSVEGNCGASSATGYKGASSVEGNCGASSATGYYGASSVEGNCGASSATGYYGASSVEGYKGASSATGNCGASSVEGYKGASSATGDYGASSVEGYKGASSATGDYGASSVEGNCGASSATGYKGKAIVGDPDSIAVAWGYHGKAKGVIGSYLVLADWEGNENNYWTQTEWNLKGAKMVRVDGVNIKEDTWYTMKNGEIVEAD